MREKYSRSGDNAKMKVFTFARNEEDLTDNSRTPTGTKIYFRSPSPSQNSLVLKFPNSDAYGTAKHVEFQNVIRPIQLNKVQVTNGQMGDRGP